MRDAALVALVERRQHLVLEEVEKAAASRASVVSASSDSSPGIAQPFRPSYPSAHQPSRMLSCRTPLKVAFIPLVPLASMGLRGRLTHRSQPATSCFAIDRS